MGIIVIYSRLMGSCNKKWSRTDTTGLSDLTSVDLTMLAYLFDLLST